MQVPGDRIVLAINKVDKLMNSVREEQYGDLTRLVSACTKLHGVSAVVPVTKVATFMNSAIMGTFEVKGYDGLAGHLVRLQSSIARKNLHEIIRKVIKPLTKSLQAWDVSS